MVEDLSGTPSPRIPCSLDDAANRAIRGAARLGRRYGSFVLVLVIWAIAAAILRAMGAPEFVLPPPDAVAAKLVESIQTGVLPAYLRSSISHLAIASITGIAIGTSLGVLIGLNRYVARFCYPLLNFFQSLGGIAVAPLLLVWFGYSVLGLVVAVNYATLTPIAFNALVGVESVPTVYVSAARTMGASRVQIIRDVILPGALPNILLGTKLGLAYGWRALIAVEMLFQLDGLGYMIFDAKQYLDTPLIILGMLLIGSMMILIDRMIFRSVEALTIERWGMLHR